MHGLLNRARKIPICAHKNNDSGQLLVFVFQETGIEVRRLPVMSCAKMSGISRHSVGFAVLLLLSSAIHIMLFVELQLSSG